MNPLKWCIRRSNQSLERNFGHIGLASYQNSDRLHHAPPAMKRCWMVWETTLSWKHSKGILDTSQKSYYHTKRENLLTRSSHKSAKSQMNDEYLLLLESLSFSPEMMGFVEKVITWTPTPRHIPVPPTNKHGRARVRPSWPKCQKIMTGGQEVACSFSSFRSGWLYDQRPHIKPTRRVTTLTFRWTNANQPAFLVLAPPIRKPEVKAILPEFTINGACLTPMTRLKASQSKNWKQSSSMTPGKSWTCRFFTWNVDQKISCMGCHVSQKTYTCGSFHAFWE